MLQGKGLAVGTLGYTLSSDARRRVERELTAEALAALRARAEQVAEALGLRVAAIETLRVGGTALPPPLPRGMAMRADAAEAAPPPVALPDRETVSLSVDAEVRLEAR
jgi:predicted secreted protein